MNYVLPLGNQSPPANKGELVTITGRTTCGKDLRAIRVAIAQNGVWRIISITCAGKACNWTCSQLNPITLELAGLVIVKPGEDVEIRGVCDRSGHWFRAMMVLTDDLSGIGLGPS